MVVPRAAVLDPALERVREKVLASERLSPEDGLTLIRTRDVFTLGELANLVRERLHSRVAYYNVNRHINYTNYCVLRCKFCSFFRTYPRGASQARPQRRGTTLPLSAGSWRHAGGYELSIDQIVALCREAVQRGATEVHMVGGLHPKLPFEYYTDMLRAIRAACPNLHIKAFTAIEIVHFARISRPRRSIEEVLIALRDAGLDSMPGGGAEIFDDRVHDEAYRAKVGEKHWFDVHRAAHDLGIPTNATMLYGHIERPEERIAHMVKLREHQDHSLVALGLSPGPLAACEDNASGDRALLLNPSNGKAAFNCFVPLSFIPEGSELAHLPGPSGLDDLRTLAVSRLMLDNFPHIKAFWPMHSPKLAQVALNWGVDDIDGTVVWYDITKREGRGTNRQELTVEQIHRLIREAGCLPVERDSLYRPVRRDSEGRVVSRATTPR